MSTVVAVGGWMMPMAWGPASRMAWPHAAASFVVMWDVMMAAMMLPSLAPALRRHFLALAGTSGRRPGGLTALVGLGYGSVWTLLGIAAFPLGVGLAAAERRLAAPTRAVPLAAGVVVMLAGAFQFTAWKAHHLACCRDQPWRGSAPPADAAAAWRHGLRFGFHCISSCAGPTAVLLAIGVMNLQAMAVVGAAVTIERLAPAGERTARAIGAVALAAGMLMVARAAGIG